ncbi:putative 28S rRNA (cytosine-C(5))-methyltransferase [Bagarius yarrelli]|uniref:Putative 28S rRNA (Cytosine-C(5))-methyltransferase n=1 Tax=Bagarius yarrelli TaxID=175774 RepID=A0A556TVK2_BAGYA|nr:putative 28S rRNA (cytosine-C(5))-methyltransferase [Bagarius yarrelli]
MVKHGGPRRTASRSFRHPSRTESSSPLTPWTSQSPPTLGHDPSFILDWNPSNIPDKVFIDAAAVFQNAQQDKATARRIVGYGNRSNGISLKVKDEVWRRKAYELAFTTLKYQELLEDIMTDSGFYLSKPVPDDLMSLVAVMLYDMQDRKFLPRERPANGEMQEEVAKVREVENCLLRFKTKLAASLARCRIKHDLLSIDCMLPESIRQRQQRGSNLPVYAWINTLRTSTQEVCEVLKSSGFCQVKSITQLEGQTFCEDIHCLDLLDKSCCVGPSMLRTLLIPDGDVIVAGLFSAASVAHTAAIVAAAHSRMQPVPHSSKQARSSTRVLVCVGENCRMDELQEVLSRMGCSNVKLLPEALHTLDVCDARLQKVRLILLTPQCSLSAVSNPVDYLLQENRIPKVRAVVYSTCSTLPEENEDVVRSALTATEQDSSKLQPFTLGHPSLLHHDKEDGSGDKKTDFFKLEASDQSNGCFLAVLAHQPEPEVTETPQEVIARATASGLLAGIQTAQPTKNQGRGRNTRKGPASQSRQRPRVSGNSQSQVTEFLNREAKVNSSTPAAAQKRTNGVLSSWGKSKPTPQPLCKPVSSSTSSILSNPSHTSFIRGPTASSSSIGLVSFTGPTPGITNTASSLLSNTAHTSSTTGSALISTGSAGSINRLTITSLSKGPALSYRTLNRTNVRQVDGPAAPSLVPLRGRQEVLRPVLISFPPPQFPSLCPASGTVKIRTPKNWRNCSRPAPLTQPRSLRPWF